MALNVNKLKPLHPLKLTQCVKKSQMLTSLISYSIAKKKLFSSKIFIRMRKHRLNTRPRNPLQMPSALLCSQGPSFTPTLNKIQSGSSYKARCISEKAHSVSLKRKTSVKCRPFSIRLILLWMSDRASHTLMSAMISATSKQCTSIDSEMPPPRSWSQQRQLIWLKIVPGGDTQLLEDPVLSVDASSCRMTGRISSSSQDCLLRIILQKRILKSHLPCMSTPTREACLMRVKSSPITVPRRELIKRHGNWNRRFWDCNRKLLWLVITHAPLLGTMLWLREKCWKWLCTWVIKHTLVLTGMIW